MNKDVIYVEPEDDITDIILKIEKANERIVALVPPKKAGVFRSIVNIKLMSKAAIGAEKTIVLVTIDPSIVKLAAATKIPVAKNLQTAPVIPVLDDEPQNETTEELSDDSNDDSLKSSEDSKSGKNDSKKPKGQDEAEKEEDEEGIVEEEKPKKEKKPSNNKFINWIKNHKKLTIFGTVFLVILIGVLIWMFVIAPAVTMKVEIQTTSKNFSENVKFTTTESEEDAIKGIFYLEEKTVKAEDTVNFTATGKKNKGEKASGELVVYKYYPINGEGGTTVVSNGLTFTVNGLTYTSTNAASLAWSGNLAKMESECENWGEASLRNSGCQISARVSVVANEPGTKYNISATQSGWVTVANVSGVYSDSAMSGGTDNEVTVVQQSDVNTAKASLTESKETENKLKLYESIDDDKIIIESSYKQTAGDAVISPNVGEEVSSGTQPSIKVTTTYSVYVISASKVKEFIENKANLGDDQKVYEMDDPYIENFAQTDKTYSGKLKTVYYSGPKITENEIMDKVKGKGLGDAQHTLKEINGITSVTIDKSYPWVNSVPNDTNKITVNFEIKDQNGNSAKKDKNNTEDSSTEETEKTDSKE